MDGMVAQAMWWLEESTIRLTQPSLAWTGAELGNKHFPSQVRVKTYRDIQTWKTQTNMQTMFVSILFNLCKFLHFARDYLCKRQKNISNLECVNFSCFSQVWRNYLKLKDKYFGLT